MEKALYQIFWPMLCYLSIGKVIVDISQDEVSVLETIRFFNLFQVLSLRSEKFADTEKLPSVIQKLLKGNPKRVFLTLSSSSISPLFLSFPGIQKEKLKQIALWDIEKNIPLPIKDVYYATKIVSTTVADGKNTWNVFALVAKKEDINQTIALFENMGIQIMQISFLPFHITSALHFGLNQNAAGVICFAQNSIDLYVIWENQVIQFAHHKGDFKNPDKVAIKNIAEYFSSFVKKRIVPLERIVVIDKSMDKIKEALSSILNIPVSFPQKEDFQPSLQKALDGHGERSDLLGFAWKADPKIEISPAKIKSARLKWAVWRNTVAAFLLLNILSFVLQPQIMITEREYAVIQNAKAMTPSEVQDEKARTLARKLQEAEELRSYESRYKELLRKMKETKSSGIESSNLKMVLAEIARFIPEEVELKSLSIQGIKGEMLGLSASSDGLEKFVVSLANSKILNNVVLQKADLIKDKDTTVVDFSIFFGVSK
jgi:Tfp pilus assembly protein PilN